MDKPPRKRDENIITGSMLTRAWLRLGLLEALLVTGAFLLVLVEAGWSPGDPTGAGSALHEDYLLATTVVFAGITTCQVGTAFATRTSHESLWRIGVFTNRMLLWGIAFELAFAAAIVYVPWLQDIFGTAALGVREIAVLATFPLVVWGSDELWRRRMRRRAGEGGGARAGAGGGAGAGADGGASAGAGGGASAGAGGGASAGADGGADEGEGGGGGG